ncbi:M81 family metallopeptidase [Roseomonas sp. OT10]|uniref:M81 family metallopeptidase n=1 Tax=Roseomonas cutis TaxID=2897332 RepID=UPI001E31234D|nr:M81 family metallopeptidase [Roseomonas sp. OT10]UFN48934.1 M81 family metallopeptidase [Roseomonas sp. OT10]
MRSDALTRRPPAPPAGPAPRIAVGRLWQETNSFNPLPTTREDFQVEVGEAMIAAYAGSATPLGGILARLGALGASAVPVLAAKARPGGPIEPGWMAELLDRMVSGIVAAAPDGVCLELHGSMAAATGAVPELDDVEGTLLARLRAALGPDTPIVAVLDLHGHVTATMVAAASFLTGYRTHPHADMVETGERAASVLMAMLAEGLRPLAARRSLPFLALSNDETSMPPMRRLRGLQETLPGCRDPRFLDLSLFNVHPFLDLPGMGQVVLAYAEDGGLAEAVAEEIAAAFWAARGEFAGASPAMAEVFAAIAESPGRPAAIGDEGDSVLAGTPGDSLALARFAAEHHPGLRGLAPVYDPAAVGAAQAAGVGAWLELALGGGITPGLEPWRLPVVVERLTAGRFANTGAYMTGVVNDHGPSAVLRHGALRLLATSRAPSATDPALATEAGLLLADLDFLVAKSGNHFRLSFASECRCLVAATPGLSARAVGFLRHRRGRPLFPIDPL